MSGRLDETFRVPGENSMSRQFMRDNDAGNTEYSISIFNYYDDFFEVKRKEVIEDADGGVQKYFVADLNMEIDY